MTLPVPSVKSVGSSGHVSDHNLLTAALAEAQTNLTAETAARTSADAALATRTTALESSVGTTFPSASTTGYGATSLTATTAGALSIVNNATFTALDITGQVTIPSGVTGVTFTNCRITGSVNYGLYVSSTGSVTLQNCEITSPAGNYNGAALAGAGSGAVVIKNCNIWGYEDGIKPSSNWTIQDSYIHDLGNNNVQIQSISNTTGSTWRYVVAPTALGTAMPFAATNSVVISGCTTSANNGTFTVTAVGSNYFEITNSSGVAQVGIAGSAGSTHCDGIQIQTGVSNVIINHNTILSPTTLLGVTSAIFVSPDLGPAGAGPVTILNNYLSGGPYTLIIVDGNNGQYHTSGLSVINNTFVNNAINGPTRITEPSPYWNAYYGNVFTDKTPVSPGVLTALQQTSINAEIAARTSGDSTLAASISSEAATRAAADTAINTALSSLSGSPIVVAGLHGDAQTFVGPTASSTATLVTAPTAVFSASDVGKVAIVYQRFSHTGALTTIASYVSPTQVRLAVNVGITANGSSDYFFTWGTDDSTAIQSALNNAAAKVWDGTAPSASGFSSSGLVDVVLPWNGLQSGYMITNQITVPTGVRLDVPSMLYNGMASRNAPCVVFNPFSGAKNFRLNGLYGSGISIGSNGKYTTVSIEDLRIWHTAGSATSPSQLTATPSTTGGTLSANTYYYVVTGIDGMGGESLLSNEVSVTTTGSTSSVSLSWTGNASFVSYKVYRGYVSRGEFKPYPVSGTTFTDTGSSVSSSMPTPPGTACSFYGYHLEVGRAYFVACGCAVVSQGTDQFWGFLDMIGCTTGFRGLNSGDIAAPAVVVDTVGATNPISGYVSEGGVWFNLNAGFIRMNVTAFSAYSTVLSPVINIGSILTAAQTGTQNWAIDLKATINNTGGTALAVANVKNSNFDIIVNNDVGYGMVSNPVTTAVVFGANVDPSVSIRATIATGITTYTGAQSGILDVVQGGSATRYPTSNTGQPNQWTPSDQNLIAWTCDPFVVIGAGAPSAGVIYGSRMKIRSQTTISYIWLWVNAVGATFTASASVAGLYDSNGNLLSTTSDFGSSTPTNGTGNLSTLGWCKIPLTTPQTVSGDVFVSFVINATTMPQLARGPGVTATNGFANVGLSTGGTATSASRFWSSGTGITSLPSTVSLSGATSPAASNFYAAVS